MKDFPAPDIVNIAAHIKHFAEGSIKADARGSWGPREQHGLKGLLEAIMRQMEWIELPATHHLCNLAIQDMESDSCSPSTAKGRGNSIRDMLSFELQSRYFLFIPEPVVRYYSEDNLLDNDGECAVAQHFPRANGEARSAGKCFATDEYTACVFHLMRVLEIALRVFSKGLGIPDPTRDWERNWGKMLGEIKSKMDANDKGQDYPLGVPTTANWVRLKSFYQQGYALFESIRNPWRNSTMHIERDYNDKEAKLIFDIVSSLMRSLSDELRE